ncbi:hypothetical protein MKJ04_14040 [Pontibacter sp. E15-1]|uniref:hypothetical protein n=1 Tax=Pontibacter sp. E15-1 TaxID=2919918 RepID=UPI001F4FFD75|nr:hypothetical protein [Pontibacter sp. E15-1]MCJ8165965.1 hypothetical protein [Pontibacter sp. E15-1]
MPLTIKVEDFKGKVVANLLDNKGMLNRLVNYCYKNPNLFKVFKYIDLYDDTTFNSLQVKDLIDDIYKLRSDSDVVDEERVLLLDQLNEFCNKSLEEPHMYLKFYGD